MQLIRTIVWILITAVLVAFVAMNWNKVPVLIWPGEPGLQIEWPVGLIAFVSYLLGFLPMWLLSKAGKWRLNRRISSLENSVRAAAPSPPPPPLATSSQLEAAVQPESKLP
jgi:lipopolysaccharide assembly protein A